MAAFSDYGSFKALLFSARKNTPSTPKLTTPVRRAIILAVPPSLSGKNILSTVPVYLLSLNAGYVKTYAAASVSVLIALPEIIAFSLPAPKLPSAVFHLKMPSSLRSFCVRASLSVSVDLHTPLIQRLYHVPTIMKFSFFVKTGIYLSFIVLYSFSMPEISVFIVYSRISFPNASDDSLTG